MSELDFRKILPGGEVFTESSFTFPVSLGEVTVQGAQLYSKNQLVTQECRESTATPKL